MTEITDKVESDPALNAAEKETTVTMFGDEKEFSIYSAKRTIVKSLLKHDHFEIDWARVVMPDRDTAERMEIFDRSQLEDVETIYAVEGVMPAGVWTIKSAPRSNNNQSSIVNAEGIDPDAFSDSDSDDGGDDT